MKRAKVLMFLLLVFFSTNLYASERKPGSSELSFVFQSIKFNELNETSPFLALEGEIRSGNLGFSVLIGFSNIANNYYEIYGDVYTESMDYITNEFNLKGYYPITENIELGVGGGISMNTFNYKLRDESSGIDVVDSKNFLFGSQLKGEIKYIFSSSAKVNGFIAFEYVYQYVEKADIVFATIDLSNRRFGIKTGIRF